MDSDHDGGGDDSPATAIGGVIILCAFAFLSIFGVILGTLGPPTRDKAPLLDWYAATVHPSYNVTIARVTAAGVPVPVPPPSLNPRYSPLPQGPSPAPLPTPTPDALAEYLRWVEAHPPTPTV